MDRKTTAPPFFDGSDYTYWKTRMRAHLKSKGADIWDITVNTNYVVPQNRATPEQKTMYDANNKAVDILFASLGRFEFDRVCDLSAAHQIWSWLMNFHEGNNQVKARLFETYRREYENFSQLPGESADVTFQRFQTIVNKMIANINVFPYTDHDRALKLLHALDRNMWGTKVDAITESENYMFLTVDDLFIKLKSSEIDMQLRAKHEKPTDPHSLVLMTSSATSSSLTNPSPSALSLSSLLSVTEEQVEALGDEELALITKRFMRFNDNRRNRRRNYNCFECGKPGHFAADCPNKNKAKAEYDYSKHKHKDDKKKKKHSDRGKRQDRMKAKARAFIASLSDVDSDSEARSSSSSEEENGVKQKEGKNFNGLCFYTKSSKQRQDGYCLMAIDAGGNDDDDSELDSKPDQQSE